MPSTVNGKNARQAVILGGARTPHGRFLGAPSSLSAVKLATQALKAALARTPINRDDVDEVIVGQIVPAGCGLAALCLGGAEAVAMTTELER